MLSNSSSIYQSVVSASQCAKLCTYYDSFHCESFDFCTDISTCFLGKVHYYDAPKANIKQMPSCVHYSREYLMEHSVANSLDIVGFRTPLWWRVGGRDGLSLIHI